MTDIQNSKLPWLIAFFGLLGLVLAAVSMYIHLQVEFGLLDGPSFCSISKEMNCETVYMSKWSSFFGISLGAYGIGFYTLMIFLGLFAKESKRFSQLAVMICCFACLFSIYLFLISKLVIGTLCIVCIGMYLANFILFALFVLMARRDKRTPSESYFACLASKKGLTAVLTSLVVFILVALIPVKFAEARFKEVMGEVVKITVDQWKEYPEEELGLSFEGAHKDYVLGPKDAPIQVVEYLDYQCPFCRQLFFELKDLRNEFGEDKISAIIKHFPLDNSCNTSLPGPMHPHACYASEVARCAGEQGQFWEMSSVLLSMPELEEESSLEDLRFAVVAAASSLGLDKVALEECLESDRQLEAIKKDIQVAGTLRLEATPSVWVNQRQVPLVSPETLRAVFKQILSEENS